MYSNNSLKLYPLSVLPTTVFASLLALLSSASNKLLWLRPALSSLLSSQLLRAGGVRALLLVVVGGDDEVGLPKLEMLSKLMATKSLELSYEVSFFFSIFRFLVLFLSSFTSFDHYRLISQELYLS